MRTTVDLKPDVVKGLEQRRQQTGEGLSESVNALLRAALTGLAEPSSTFRQRSTELGLRIDVRNIGDVLDALDQR